MLGEDGKFNTKEFESTTVLSNATQVACEVIKKVSGNEVADGFGGEQLSEDELSQLVGAKIGGYLKNPSVGGQ